MNAVRLTPEQRKLVVVRTKRAALWLKEVRLIREIAPTCAHPITSAYRREHDDGYGKQGKVEGRRCDLCEAVDRWGTGGWSPRAWM